MDDTPRSNAALAARDLRHVWHPCTQMHDHERVPLVPIVRGEGAWLVDADGRRYLDGISSWWTNLFGHANPRIAAALAEQARTLEHVIFAGFTHEPAIRLAEELVRVAPPGLARVFFADNGSAAVEVALKMSFHCWLNRGHGEKTRFVALTGSYHGETLGALSVSDVALYRRTYAPLLLTPILAPSPDAYEGAPGETPAQVAARRLGELRALLERHAHEVCAVIVEPLVQCAGGMRMHHPDYLAGLRRLCDEFGVHFIADEIAVGFGRTGTLFACEQAGVSPDFLCLSKGLTGGTLPLSAVLTTEPVYQAFYAEYSAGKAFLHSHSYTGNPLACRAALETLAIFRDEPVLERNRGLAAHLARRLEPLRAHPHVADVRQTGMIAAVELVADKAARRPFPAAERRGLRVYLHGLAHGALLRPLGDVIYFMPPYVVDEGELDHLVDTAVAGIARAVAG
ncbi:adenosylmethionine--8-amino-7-oxononanoate transaminase [Fulvimonas soli]|jgi:adenosylmethionine-8-amino-7-oxononanoate aminotransferase|uniref:Adenosylmethionine-8-amino-7-oxononanoate aminotransferase n=1 Tax=Fulvimonas soli TaxID=155197 RepID=A0A316IBR2_9GAMM|nr:adenosylmethionine--8-amino-7-oxononanoate transaminase [Fulvimonas soli]PWK84746.1 adenosylmethionine-8-amino-7-oxononanoate aminotransferase [Fulvimonas soli]TNY27329.1 adenosylmethionine--8-amino-7-oxononanoate transaminase [Fulvimonas soli]